MTRLLIWLPDQDSNPNKMSQSHLCYPYTIRQYKWCEQWDLNPHAISTRPSNVPVCRFQHARIVGIEGPNSFSSQPLHYNSRGWFCQALFENFLKVFLGRGKREKPTPQRVGSPVLLKMMYCPVFLS